MSGAEGSALSEAAFAALLDPLGPFEPEPLLAVGVSGGGDSLALAFLARRWAQARGGRVLALTVDHGLRPEAAAEAREAGRRLASLGVEQKILRWRGPKPQANLQEAARAARLGLMAAACRKAGILHLLLAQNLEDQAETLLLRLARGSGLDGLAAMAPLAEQAELRLLRPLLTVPRADLRETLRAAGLAWSEDPSNRDPRFARARLRRSAALLEAEGLGAARLAATAAHLGRARQALELATRDLLVAACATHPAGFLAIDRALLLAAPEEVALRALARTLATAGGAEWPPRFERLQDLYARLRQPAFKAATLNGCRMLAREGGQLLMVRESRNLAAATLEPGREGQWDGRFAWRLGRPAVRPWKGALRLEALGAVAPAKAEAALPGAKQGLARIPAPARPSLPALRDAGGLAGLPALGLYRDPGLARALAAFRPAPLRSLIGAGFRVV